MIYCVKNCLKPKFLLGLIWEYKTCITNIPFTILNTVNDVPLELVSMVWWLTLLTAACRLVALGLSLPYPLPLFHVVLYVQARSGALDQLVISCFIGS